MEDAAILLMVVVGVLLIVEIVNYGVKYRRLGERKNLVSLIIIFISFVFWLISMIMMVQKFYIE